MHDRRYLNYFLRQKVHLKSILRVSTRPKKIFQNFYSWGFHAPLIKIKIFNGWRLLDQSRGPEKIFQGRLETLSIPTFDFDKFDQSKATGTKSFNNLKVIQTSLFNMGIHNLCWTFWFLEYSC